VLPPFEGWDEYQHLAYFDYLTRNEKPPEMWGACVSPNFLAVLRGFPQPAFALDQLRDHGARSYAAFWAGGPSRDVGDAEIVRLYSGHHGPAYYRLASPLWNYFAERGGILAQVFALRLLNLVFGTATIYVVGLSLHRVLANPTHADWVLLLVGLQPLFLVNTARVANDALAILLAAVGVQLLLTSEGPRAWRFAIAGGFAFGVSLVVKPLCVTAIPGILAIVTAGVWGGRLTRRQAWIAGAAFFTTASVLVVGALLDNLHRHGMAMPLQEFLRNRHIHTGATDYARSILEIDWRRELYGRYAHSSLWIGGWSFLRLPLAIVRIHEALLWCSLIGGVIGLWRTVFSARSWPQNRAAILVAATMAFGAAAGLAFHMLQMKTAFAFVGTPVWYACSSFPWLLLLVYVGFCGWPIPNAGAVGAAAMGLLFLVADLLGIFGVMIPQYTSAKSIQVQWDRLIALHPPGLGPPLTIFAVVGLCLVGGLVLLTRHASVPNPLAFGRSPLARATG
jgi:hypothetical protein